MDPTRPDHAPLDRGFSEASETPTKHSAHRWMLGGGCALIALVLLASSSLQPKPPPVPTSSASSTAQVWTVLEPLDPELIARRLRPLLNRNTPPAEIKQAWEESLPDLLKIPAYQALLRKEIEAATGERLLLALERVTALEGVFQAIASHPSEGLLDPVRLLPDKYHERLLTVEMMQFHINNRMHPFTSGLVMGNLKPAPDQSVEEGSQDTMLNRYKNGGQFRVTEIFQTGGFKASPVLGNALGLKEVDGPPLKARWTYHVDFQDDLSHLRCQDFLLGLYCDNLIGCRIRLEINSRLSIVLSQPPLPIEGDKSSEQGHRLHYRRLPSTALQQGKNRIIIELLPPLRDKKQILVWIGTLYLRTCPPPGP